MSGPVSRSLERMFGLEGRVALVTGASRGLGRAMAFGLAGVGAHVIVNSRDRTGVKKVAQEIAGKGFAASSLAFDVEDEQACADAFAAIAERHGRLDVLVSNAGIRHRAPIEQMSAADFNRVFANHVTAALVLSKLAVPLMRRNAYGRVILISSVGASQARAGDVAYHAAKGAVSSLTRALACEFGPDGITCNAIAPGLFATEVNQGILSDARVQAALKSGTALQRNAEVEEIAGAAVFLASASASYVTGHILTVDGGMTIHV